MLATAIGLTAAYAAPLSRFLPPSRRIYAATKPCHRLGFSRGHLLTPKPRSRPAALSFQRHFATRIFISLEAGRDARATEVDAASSRLSRTA